MAQSDNKLYSAAEEWAEPNVDEASAALLELYDNCEKRLTLGAAAKVSILNQYSIGNFKKTVMQYMCVKG
jgi:hypothetical protein